MGTFFHGIYILEIYIILIAIPILLLEAFVLIYDRIFQMYLKLYPEQASLFEKEQMKAKGRDNNMYGIHSWLLQLISATLLDKKAPDVATEQFILLVDESKAQAVYPLTFSVLDSQL